MHSTLFDFHSHVLPKMDDGSADLVTSRAMLEALARQGIGGVYCTPHFLPMYESPADFINRRKQAHEALKAYLSSCGVPSLPEIRLGAEIRVIRGISESDLDGLEYEGTQAVLLELPREALSRQIVNEICNLCAAKGYIPIIAHLDRYKWFSHEDVDALSEIPDVVFQLNTEALSRHSRRKEIMRLLQSGRRIIFASDCHNTVDRSPDFHLLTGNGGRSPISEKERTIFLEAHNESQSFIFGNRAQNDTGLFF
ncbi:MAG: hypothetical protein IKB23_05270 [Clostridia bacterium]|nr:hypothetical protein [Clostridia bacterium]